MKRCHSFKLVIQADLLAPMSDVVIVGAEPSVISESIGHEVQVRGLVTIGLFRLTMILAKLIEDRLSVIG